MATAVPNEVVCSLVEDGILKLEHTKDLDTSNYSALAVLPHDMLMLIDGASHELHMHCLKSGRLLDKFKKLQSKPRNLCRCVVQTGETKVAVALKNGQVQILKVVSATIIPERTLDLSREFAMCLGVKAIHSGTNLLVSGLKDGWFYWSTVSIVNGHVNNVHKIREGMEWTYLATSHDDSIVYISCLAGLGSPNNGVYAFDINTGSDKFVYQSNELNYPSGISVDKNGFIYVCNYSSGIHQLTERGELLTVHLVVNIYGLYAIDLDEEQQYFYITSIDKNEVMRLRPVFNHSNKQGGHGAHEDDRKQPVAEETSTAIQQGLDTEEMTYQRNFVTDEVLPPEILNKDESFQKLYKEVLASGKEKAYNIRVMIVGNQGVGKTSLIQRLLGEEVKEDQRESTEGIEVHTRCCQIDHTTGEWRRKDKIDELFLNDQRIANILHKYSSCINKQKRKATDAEDDISPTKIQKPDLHSKETVPSLLDRNSDSLHNETAVSQILKESDHSEASTPDLPMDKHTGNGLNEAKRMCPGEISNFVERAQYLPISRSSSSDVTLLDFAGQSLFYTTHQVFMSWRTLYLLVTNMSLPLTDAVEEGEYRIDLSGRKFSNIQEYVTYWLNSVHSHALVPEDYMMRKEDNKPGRDEPSEDVQVTRKHPFVILVGTHSDKIPKELLDQRKESYFKDIRIALKNSPLMLHLVDEDFAISNLGSDPNINALKTKIFDVARKQVYWGEEIPARWIRFERALIELKNRGIQVMTYADVKSLNDKLQVNIQLPEEFDMFLRFEHDSGNIIFFNTERLRKNVVLDPEWLINGVRTWITSDQCINIHPELTEQWLAFKHTGRLTRTLLEKLWSSHSDIDQYEQHLLEVMEKLNIIAKPLQNEEEDYYWVPSMVSKSAPEEVKTLQQNKDTTRTSTLCFRSKTNFIHVGVFHRLLATCLSKWEPAKEGNTYFLFRGLCVFNIDNQHQLFISLNDFVIHATVIRFTKRARIPDLSRCMAIRDELYTALSEISDCLCPGSELEICIKCKESSPLTNEGLHSISTLRTDDELRCSTHKGAHCVESKELLGFWEEDKKQIPASVLPQHSTLPSERFTRIVSLVLDVGSKVLRELLTCCTNASNCTLDQYMKANEPQIRQLLTRKVLTQDQLDIIFPPNGETDINEYDITLASALLYNIYPLLGQPEKQLIIDLRTQRNELAHSHSTKMSEKDFQIKWSKVQTILSDLCKLCKDPNVDSKVQKEILDIQMSGSCAIIAKLTTIREELKYVSNLLEEIETT